MTHKDVISLVTSRQNVAIACQCSTRASGRRAVNGSGYPRIIKPAQAAIEQAHVNDAIERTHRLWHARSSPICAGRIAQVCE
jgi:hypothetical protein